MVHVRDPRQAIHSLEHHFQRYTWQMTKDMKNFYSEMTLSEKHDYMIMEWLPGQIQWISRWANAKERIDVRFTTFEKFMSNRDGFIDTILENYGGDTAYFDKSTIYEFGEGVDTHFRSGQTDEWRGIFAAAQINRMNELIPENFWNLFHWSP